MLIAKMLKEKVSYFAKGIEAKDKITTFTQHQRMCIEVSKNFMKIHALKHREAVNILVETLAKKTA